MSPPPMPAFLMIASDSRLIIISGPAPHSNPIKAASALSFKVPSTGTNPKTTKIMPAINPNIIIGSGIIWLSISIKVIVINIPVNTVNAKNWPVSPKTKKQTKNKIRITSYNVCYTKLLRIMPKQMP